MFGHTEIKELLEELARRLERAGIRGEMMVVGGAAIALAFNIRRETKDIDAIFEPKMKIYEIAEQMATERGLPKGWLNDAVKGFLSPEDPGDEVLFETPGLVVRVPSAEYLFAMKALAARPEDFEDLKILGREIGIRTLDHAFSIVEKYYPRDRIPPRTAFFLQEVFFDEF